MTNECFLLPVWNENSNSYFHEWVVFLEDVSLSEMWLSHKAGCIMNILIWCFPMHQQWGTIGNQWNHKENHAILTCHSTAFRTQQWIQALSLTFPAFLSFILIASNLIFLYMSTSLAVTPFASHQTFQASFKQHHHHSNNTLPPGLYPIVDLPFYSLCSSC